MNDQKLSEWQLSYIKRLPVSQELIQQILREEYNVDFYGNPLPQREYVDISRKKKKRSAVEEIITECKENPTFKNVTTGEETCLSMEQDP